MYIINNINISVHEITLVIHQFLLVPPLHYLLTVDRHQPTVRNNIQMSNVPL